PAAACSPTPQRVEIGTSIAFVIRSTTRREATSLRLFGRWGVSGGASIRSPRSSLTNYSGLQHIIRDLERAHEIIVPRLRDRDRPQRGLAVEAEDARAGRERLDVRPSPEVVERARLVDEDRHRLVDGTAPDGRRRLHPLEDR